MEDQSGDEAKTRDEDDDEDSPQLSEHALAALQEFYAERLAKEQQLAASLESGSACVHTHVEEDWVAMNIIRSLVGRIILLLTSIVYPHLAIKPILV